MLEATLYPDIFRERLRDLCKRYHGLVRRACRRYVQHRDDADDLTQEVLVKAARGWDTFTGDCERSTWLYKVAANHCADHLRWRKRQHNLMRLYAADRDPPHPAVETGDVLSGATDVLEDLRSGLGCQDRHIVYLRFDVGMKRDGIARITGLSRASVTRRLVKIQERAARLWFRRNRREWRSER
jgi:RNA polymerase sigma-70 factor (ECF subfamily)